MSFGEKRARTSQPVLAFIVVAFGIASCSGSNGDDAPGCVSSAYPLGCVGDGRPASSSTPASLPTNRCAKDAYTLVRVDMQTASPRNDVDRCQLSIADASGNPVQEYELPRGGLASDGSTVTYGCSGGLTPANIGTLSYSVCCGNRGPLTFTLTALDANGSVVQKGTAPALDCAHYPPEIFLSLIAKRTN
jgi:hypothetical protein